MYTKVNLKNQFLVRKGKNMMKKRNPSYDKFRKRTGEYFLGVVEKLEEDWWSHIEYQLICPGKADVQYLLGHRIELERKDFEDLTKRRLEASFQKEEVPERLRKKILSKAKKLLEDNLDELDWRIVEEGDAIILLGKGQK